MARQHSTHWHAHTISHTQYSHLWYRMLTTLFVPVCSVLYEGETHAAYQLHLSAAPCDLSHCPCVLSSLSRTPSGFSTSWVTPASSPSSPPTPTSPPTHNARSPTSTNPTMNPCSSMDAAPGHVVDARSGTGKPFGWDPIFEPSEGQESDSRKTFAEMDKQIKNRISHRAKALTMVKEYFAQHPHLVQPQPQQQQQQPQS